MVFEASNSQYHQAEVSVKILCEEYTSLEGHGTDGTRKPPAFPNATLPNFHRKVHNLVEVIDAVSLVAFAPLVHAWQKTAWEEYAVAHQGWIREDLNVAGVESTTSGSSIPSAIYDWKQDSDTKTVDTTADTVVGMHFPVWQVAPPPLDASESPMMLDLYSIPWIQESIDHVLSTKRTTLSPIHDMGILTNYASVEGHESEHSIVQTEEMVHSLLIEPVFDTFDTDTRRVVGVVMAVVNLVVVYSGILEDEAEGMIIDVENTCDSSRHSFFIGDDETHYLGSDFMHNPKFAFMTQRKRLGDEGEGDDSSDDRRRRRRRNLDQDSEDKEEDSDDIDECGFYVSAHCSEIFVENWERNTSVMYTVIVLSIFLFTGLVFFIYDLLVQRRQQKVMDTAEKTTAIVSSLFPKEVRERMMAEQKSADKKMRLFAMDDESNSGGTSFDSAPIADAFEETT